MKTQNLRKMISEEFSPVMEHDSHEFLLYFLNNLKDELTEVGTKLPMSTKLEVNILWQQYTRSFPSVIDSLFTVIERAEVKCLSCRNVEHSLQYYLTFPLQVEGMKTLQQSLSLYS